MRARILEVRSGGKGGLISDHPKAGSLTVEPTPCEFRSCVQSFVLGPK